jgi:CheY-like chemotaxis protein
MAGQKILVADDSSQMRMMVRDALEPCGYSVVEAVDGADALKKAVDEQPDLVLLDLTMPELDGFEVLQFMQTRADTCDIKVMMLTGSAETSNQQYGYTLGAIGYIVKPFASQELQLAVERALGLSR